MIVFVLGIITAQILNVLIRSHRRDSREYLIYGIYLSAFVLYLVALYIEDIMPSLKHPGILFWADEIKRPLGIILYILYNLFIIAFLDLKTTQPLLYRFIRWFCIYLGASVLFQIFVQSYFRGNDKVQGNLYAAFSIFVFVVSTYLIYRVWKVRNRLSAYILTGTICLSIGIFLTNIINYLMMLEKLEDGEYYFYPLLAGLGLEIYYFNRGLHYKTTRTEKDLIHTQELLIEQMSEKEKLLVDKQEIRNKIARDLHDNIGSTLSSISVYSRVARIYQEQEKQQPFEDVMSSIEKASAEMIGEMNDIVWAINPGNDSIENMLLRMDAFARPLLQAAGIHWHFECDAAVKSARVDMFRRKNIYLVFKEAVNNAVKYAGCKNISVSISRQATSFRLQITDDGRGFNSQPPLSKNNNPLSGNGISNMQRRAAEMNGSLHLNSIPGTGTTVSLEIPSPY